MFRLKAIACAGVALFPFMTASAIKVTLSGEIELGASNASLETYDPTPTATADLNFDISHSASDTAEIGGNLDLDITQDFSGGSSTPELSLSKADIFWSSEFGKTTFTTDGELDNAGSYLSVAEEVDGENDDLALIFSLPDVSGLSADLAVDVINTDVAISLGYTHDLAEVTFDLEPIGDKLFVDGEIESDLQGFTGNVYTAIGTDYSTTEFEAALKLAYNFGVAEIFAGMSNYLEFAGGVSFETAGLTLSLDGSGMAAGNTVPTRDHLTTTTTVPDSYTVNVGAEYEYEDHLTVVAKVTGNTVGSTTTGSGSFTVELSF